MYENGKQINHYANKMIHKRNQKNKYRRDWFRGLRCSSWEDYVAHAKEWDDLKYWKEFYLSDLRKCASDFTNSKLRTEFRNELANCDYEDMIAPQHSDYKKYFDYALFIW